MDKQEPRIISGDLSNEELLGWMDRKVRSARMLGAALAERESLKQTLVEVEQRISELSTVATVQLADKEEDPTPR
ncbi:hypothetical protein [Rahnella victoriana]|uniref:hypothetical protein n=1 Tax=Rahnella victoriana TaxID=1510570 RepID=UPI000F502300|nr:hypothetical protein [Rahnella victoriana]